MIPEVSPQELAAVLANLNAIQVINQSTDPSIPVQLPVQLIDVREPEEVEWVSLPGFVVLPLSQFAQWAEAIATAFDPQRETWVLCHHGMRSYQMCAWLQSQGFANVKNIRGGIHAYACEVDRRLPRY